MVNHRRRLALITMGFFLLFPLLPALEYFNGIARAYFLCATAMASTVTVDLKRKLLIGGLSCVALPFTMFSNYIEGIAIILVTVLLGLGAMGDVPAMQVSNQTMKLLTSSVYRDFRAIAGVVVVFNCAGPAEEWSEKLSMSPYYQDLLDNAMFLGITGFMLALVYVSLDISTELLIRKLRDSY